MASLVGLLDPFGLRHLPVRAAETIVAGPIGIAIVRAAVDAGLAERLADELLDSGAAERIAERLASGPELDRLVEGALASPRTAALVERMLANPGMDRLITRALDSELVDASVARVLASDELWIIVAAVARSPAVTEAIAHQGFGFADQLADEVGDRSRRADARLERLARKILHRPPSPGQAT
jgi:hypothetical protein